MKPRTMKVEMKYDCLFEGGVSVEVLESIAKHICPTAVVELMTYTVKTHTAINQTDVTLEFDTGE